MSKSVTLPKPTVSPPTGITGHRSAVDQCTKVSAKKPSMSQTSGSTKHRISQTSSSTKPSISQTFGSTKPIIPHTSGATKPISQTSGDTKPNISQTSGITIKPSFQPNISSTNNSSGKPLRSRSPNIPPVDPTSSKVVVNKAVINSTSVGCTDSSAGMTSLRSSQGSDCPWITDPNFPKCSPDEILRKKQDALNRRQKNKLKLSRKK